MNGDFDQVGAGERHQVCTTLAQALRSRPLSEEVRPHLPLVVTGRLVHDGLTKLHGPMAVTRFFAVLFPKFRQLGLGPLQSSFLNVRSLEQSVLGGIARAVLGGERPGDVEERVLEGARHGFAQYLEHARAEELLSSTMYQALLDVADLAPRPTGASARYVM